MATWSSNHDCISAQINGKTKRAIHEWIALGIDQIYESQICENNSKFK